MFSHTLTDTQIFSYVDHKNVIHKYNVKIKIISKENNPYLYKMCNLKICIYKCYNLLHDICANVFEEKKCAIHERSYHIVPY